MELAKQVIIPTENEGFYPEPGHLIGTFDVQYEGEKAFAAIDLLRWPDEHVETYVGAFQPGMEYVPGLFAFREGPVLINLLQAVQQQFGYEPDLLIVDGHGLAHPRKFGIGCWLGVETGKPVIGCAKKGLLRYSEMPESSQGQTAPIHLDGELVGQILRTQDHTRPVFVSPGHLIGIEKATSIILALTGKYRIPEPLRRADQLVRLAAKGTLPKGVNLVSDWP